MAYFLFGIMVVLYHQFPGLDNNLERLLASFDFSLEIFVLGLQYLRTCHVANLFLRGHASLQTAGPTFQISDLQSDRFNMSSDCDES